MFDKQLVMSDKQAITGAAGTTVCTNKIDLQGGTPGFTTDTLGNTVLNDPGRSEVDVLITVTEQFAGGDSVNFQLGADNDSAFGSPTILATSGAIAIATLKPGYQVRLRLPAGIAAADKYLGVQYVTLGAGAMTAGKVFAALIMDDARPTAPGAFV